MPYVVYNEDGTLHSTYTSLDEESMLEITRITNQPVEKIGFQEMEKIYSENIINEETKSKNKKNDINFEVGIDF